MKRALVLLAVSGCLQIPEPPAPECVTSADCETAIGEACVAGVCYGGPPAGQFAGVLVPPSTRTDLVSYELPTLALPADGDLGPVTFETGVALTGRVEAACALPACNGNSAGASLLVTRPSLFRGGPGFQTIALAQDGAQPGSNTFTIVVPRTKPGDPPYTISVVPAGNGLFPPTNGTLSPAMLAPPTSLSVTTDVPSLGTITLGAADATTISGSLVDGAGHALVKYRVVARGRFAPDGALTDVSSVAYTTNGQFSLALAPTAIGPISIVARPYDPMVVAPTLTLAGLDVHAATRTIAQPPNLGSSRDVSILIEGLAGNGEVAPVSGAHVTVTATYDGMPGTASAVLSKSATTGDDGMALLKLLDGPTLAGSYQIQVVPPAGSPLGAVYNLPLSLDTLDPVRLPSRVALHGRVLDPAHKPVAGLAVTARPSVRFKWTMPDADSLGFLGEIPAATGVTGPAGDFVVYVDLSVGTGPTAVWGFYDLALDAPIGVALASYTVADIMIPRDPTLENLNLDDTILPDTAYLHGTVTDSGHVRIPGGELRVFQVETDSTVCGEVPFPPPGCVMPAQLLGRAASDDTGALKLALPR